MCMHMTKLGTTKQITWNEHNTINFNKTMT